MSLSSTLPHLAPAPLARIRPRSAILISSDGNFRQLLGQRLTGLRWQVREAESGAQAWAEAEASMPEAVIVDSWLPDLDLTEFLREFRLSFPRVDVLTSEGSNAAGAARSPYRQEILYALRTAQDTDTAAWNTACELGDARSLPMISEKKPVTSIPEALVRTALDLPDPLPTRPVLLGSATAAPRRETPSVERLPELVGNAPCMLEVSRRIRLVAPRSTPVLIEGPTGSGKELVAEALHRLSTRSRKPFVAINCAAIPEALLEAELFGHTRGAFTGAVQGRMGRIEAADGGTLFLDEIGEMPLSLQAKLLRFVECGELQRVGDNETLKVDVRILAATHRPLAKHTKEGTFRSDLYYRLAVFLIRTPGLAEHPDDLPHLVQHFLAMMGRSAPLKRIAAPAMAKLAGHTWPGSVRELEHVLERAAILAGDDVEITAEEIDFGLDVN